MINVSFFTPIVAQYLCKCNFDLVYNSYKNMLDCSLCVLKRALIVIGQQISELLGDWPTAK